MSRAALWRKDGSGEYVFFDLGFFSGKPVSGARAVASPSATGALTVAGWWSDLSDSDGGRTFPARWTIPRNAAPPPPLNTPPLASPHFYETDRNVALEVAAPGVLENAYDRDGDAITAELRAAPEKGTVAIEPDGSFVYVPYAGFTGIDHFTYAAWDGTEATEAAVTVHVLSAADILFLLEGEIAVLEIDTVLATPVGLINVGTEEEWRAFLMRVVGLAKEAMARGRPVQARSLVRALIRTLEFLFDFGFIEEEDYFSAVMLARRAYAAIRSACADPRVVHEPACREAGGRVRRARRRRGGGRARPSQGPREIARRCLTQSPAPVVPVED